jgi:hypothetical protein
LSNGAGSEVTSFRGKVYADLVEAITDYSLYEAKISQDGIQEIADKLEAYSWTAEDEETYEIEASEFQDLCRMFRTYADLEEGCVLVSWY